MRTSYKAYQAWMKTNGYSENSARLPGLNTTENQLFFLSFAQVCNIQSSLFIPQLLMAKWVLFSPKASGWTGRWWEQLSFPCCISQTVRCRKLILDRDIGWGCNCATLRCDLDLTCDLAVTFSLNILPGLYLGNHKVYIVDSC